MIQPRLLTLHSMYVMKHLIKDSSAKNFTVKLQRAVRVKLVAQSLMTMIVTSFLRNNHGIIDKQRLGCMKFPLEQMHMVSNKNFAIITTSLDDTN